VRSVWLYIHHCRASARPSIFSSQILRFGDVVFTESACVSGPMAREKLWSAQWPSQRASAKWRRCQPVSSPSIYLSACARGNYAPLPFSRSAPVPRRPPFFEYSKNIFVNAVAQFMLPTSHAQGMGGAEEGVRDRRWIQAADRPEQLHGGHLLGALIGAFLDSFPRERR